MTFSKEDDDWARVIHEYPKSSSQSEKVNFSLVAHSTFYNKCRNWTFLCMKSEWEIEYIESSYFGRLRTFSPGTAGGLAKRSKRSIFDSLFYAEKWPFPCMCWKKVFFFSYLNTFPMLKWLIVFNLLGIFAPQKCANLFLRLYHNLNIFYHIYANVKSKFSSARGLSIFNFKRNFYFETYYSTPISKNWSFRFSIDFLRN